MEARLRARTSAGPVRQFVTFNASGVACVHQKLDDGDKPTKAGSRCYTGDELHLTAPAPGNVGGSPGAGTAKCEDEGNACQVQPAGCSGRGSDWKVAGTIECRSGRSVCVANTDAYCDSCGSKCGACAGSTCRSDSDCGHGLICGHRGPGQGGIGGTCRVIDRCFPKEGYCWTPGEVGSNTAICNAKGTAAPDGTIVISQ